MIQLTEKQAIIYTLVIVVATILLISLTYHAYIAIEEQARISNGAIF